VDGFADSLGAASKVWYTATDSQIETSTSEGPMWHRYSFDGYGETSSGADYTGSGTGSPWPVLSGERGEYDIADGNLSGAKSMLSTMAGAANSGYQISEQVWAGPNGTGGFTTGKPDNSSTPLMWAMAQFVRLAADISAGGVTETPSIVSPCLTSGSCPAAGTVKETVTVTVPVSTDASTHTVYLDGNLSALGYGAADWASDGIPMTRVSATQWTATVHRLRRRGHPAVLQVHPGQQLVDRGGDRLLRLRRQPVHDGERRHGQRHGRGLGRVRWVPARREIQRSVRQKIRLL
jgi:hypothetical protein